MHKAGVKAMEATAGSEELKEWKAACNDFSEVMEAENEAEKAKMLPLESMLLTHLLLDLIILLLVTMLFLK